MTGVSYKTPPPSVIDMTAPLDDVEVVELTQMVAGSFAGMHLADLGADVVKIERPGFGEIARNIEPTVGGESFYYMSVNRGKQSVTLDLATDTGRDAFLRLAETADVVLENFTPGTLSSLGVGYEAVRQRNPDVVYCSVSAFGETGPKRDHAGVDPVIQAYGGITSMTRDTDGRPLRVGVVLADLAGGLYAVQGIMAALRRREQTGEGDHLDVALSDCLLSLLSVRAGYSFATGDPFPSIARSHVYFAPEGIFTTADGYLQVSTVTQDQWARLTEAIERDDLRENSKFDTLAARRANRAELNEILEEEFADRPTRDWIDRLENYDVPVQHIHDTLSVWEDDHTIARDMVAPVITPEGEEFPTVDYPVKHRTWDRCPPDYIAPLGADSRVVLREAGVSEDVVDSLLMDRSGPQDS